MFRWTRTESKPFVVFWLTLALCVIWLIAANAREAAKDSAHLIKPLALTTPGGEAQNNQRVKASRRRRTRRTRRTRARVTTRQSAARQAATTRVMAKPREVQGVIVDSAESLPNNASEPSTRPATTVLRPRGPISGGVLNGRALSLPVPPYPLIARAANAGGTVVVQVLIDEYGNVVEAHAVSGHPLLQKAAEEAARNARFAPTRLSGQPVKVTGVITYNFVP